MIPVDVDPCAPHHHCVYALVDPRDNTVRYVGYTAQYTDARLRDHLDMPVNPRVRSWLTELRRCFSAKPSIRVLEFCCGPTWEEREGHWIKHFRQRGHILNIDPGGICRDASGRLLPGIRKPKWQQRKKKRKKGKSHKGKQKWNGKIRDTFAASLADISARQMGRA
jgi:hypothetical protein